MSSYRQNHRSFHNHTHRHQQQQRSYNPRNVPRRSNYQSSRGRHHNFHDDPRMNASSSDDPRVNDSSSEDNRATDDHQNIAPQFQDLHITPASGEIIEVSSSVVVNNHSPYGLNSSSATTTYNDEQVDEVDVATDHLTELNETSGMLDDDTDDMLSQQIQATISYLQWLCRRASSYSLTGTYRPIYGLFMPFLKLRTYSALAKDGVDPEGVVADVESSEICAICLSEYEHEDCIGRLRCGHEYHVRCIRQWLLQKKDCPVCRAPALSYVRGFH